MCEKNTTSNFQEKIEFLKSKLSKHFLKNIKKAILSVELSWKFQAFEENLIVEFSREARFWEDNSVSSLYEKY